MISETFEELLVILNAENLQIETYQFPDGAWRTSLRGWNTDYYEYGDGISLAKSIR